MIINVRILILVNMLLVQMSPFFKGFPFCLLHMLAQIISLLHALQLPYLQLLSLGLFLPSMMLGLLVCLNYYKCIVDELKIIKNYLQVHLYHYLPFRQSNLSFFLPVLIFQLPFEKVSLHVDFIPFRILSLFFPFISQLYIFCQFFVFYYSFVQLSINIILSYVEICNDGEIDVFHRNHTQDLTKFPLSK